MDTTKYKSLMDDLVKIKTQRKLTVKEADLLNRVSKFLWAENLGLKYFMFQGGIVENTLSFCREKNGKVFSIDEMLNWKNSTDRPSDEKWDPILHLGGNMCEKEQTLCRHSMDFISFSAAKRLRPEIE